jgi:hypothetical protein
MLTSFAKNELFYSGTGRFKYYYYKFIEFVIGLLQYSKPKLDDIDIPEPKMMKNFYPNHLINENDLLKIKEKAGDSKITINVGTNQEWDVNEIGWKTKLLIATLLCVTGVLIITVYGDDVWSVIVYPFKMLGQGIWNFVTHPFTFVKNKFLTVVAGISYLISILRGGDGPGGAAAGFSNTVRDFNLPLDPETGEVLFDSPPSLDDNDNDVTLSDNRLDKGKKREVIFNDQTDTVIFDNKQSTSSLNKNLSVKTSINHDDLTKESSPILSNIDTKEVFSRSSVESSSKDSSTLNFLDQIKNRKSNLLKKFSFIEAEAISQDDLNAGLATIEGMNVDKMEALISDVEMQTKIDSHKTRSSNPIAESLSKSPLLAKAMDEADEAEDAFSDHDDDYDADRLRAMKNKMKSNLPEVNIPTVSTIVDQAIDDYNIINNRGFAPKLPYQTPSQDSVKAVAIITRAGRSAARKFISDDGNNPFIDFWN